VLETVEIISVNPLYPPSLGGFLSWGTPPDPRQEVSCTSADVLETAEIVSINPLLPQSWGTSEAGGHPQTPGRKYPAPLF